MALIQTKKLNTWLGTALTPEQVEAEPERYEEMVVAIDELAKIGEIKRAQQKREQAVRNWFAAQQKGHKTYMSYRQ